MEVNAINGWTVLDIYISLLQKRFNSDMMEVNIMFCCKYYQKMTKF